MPSSAALCLHDGVATGQQTLVEAQHSWELGLLRPTWQASQAVALSKRGLEAQDQPQAIYTHVAV
jgi:hypothetical protein